MLFHEGIVMGEIGDTVGGEEVFELESVDAGSVGLFDIVVVVVVVELIDDADAERAGIGKAAEVNNR